MKNPGDQPKANHTANRSLLQGWRGWSAIIRQLRAAAAGPLAHNHQAVVAVECSNRINAAALLAGLRSALPDATVLDCRQTLKIQTLIDTLVAPWLEPHSPPTRCPLSMKQFLDADRLEAFTKSVAEHAGLVVVAGPGASCCCRPDVLAYADNAGEINGNGNHPSDYSFSTSSPAIEFRQWARRWRLIDMPVARQLAEETRPHWNYFLNVDHADPPTMVAAAELWPAIKLLAGHPFTWQPKVHPHDWKTSHWSFRPAPYGSVNIATTSGILPITTDHLFSREGPSLQGTASAALHRFTGLCPGEILMQVVTEDIFGGTMYNKESPVMPDFIAHEQLTLDRPADIHTNESMHILVGTYGAVQLEYWTKIPEKNGPHPPDGNLALTEGQMVIIPAEIGCFRLNAEARHASRGGPVLYHWALGTTGSH